MQGWPWLAPTLKTTQGVRARTSMASFLAASCPSSSAIWLAEDSSSSCSELWRCWTSFRSRRISRSLAARAASSLDPEHME